MAAILVVDDESGIREFVTDVLTDLGHEVVQAGDGHEALRHLEDRPFDLVMLDLNMPGNLGGLDVLRRARAEWPEMQALVLTAHGTVGTAVEAMRLGAFDFLEKPIAGPDALRRLVSRALNWRGKRREREVPAAALAIERAAAAQSRGDAPATGGRSALRHFLWELKRRHVYNLSVTYAAVCFIVLQVAEVTLPALPVPDWAHTAIVVLAIAGFPIVVVFGWIYDLTATGLKRSPPAEPGADPVV
jgi:DNA-binding response OmpR family regulator